jgi:hypothetical protein
MGSKIGSRSGVKFERRLTSRQPTADLCHWHMGHSSIRVLSSSDRCSPNCRHCHMRSVRRLRAKTRLMHRDTNGRYRFKLLFFERKKKDRLAKPFGSSSG